MNDRPDKNFKERVYSLVLTIPKGKVMTYGDIASLCGHAYAARIVGGLAHFGPPELPWQRVVNRHGGLASGYYGGKEGHRKDLEAEGVAIADDFTVKEFEKLRWRPALPNR